MLELSKSQSKILDAIVVKINKFGYPPSVREICESVGLRSTSTVHSHLNKLEKLGYIKRDPSKPRAIEVLKDDRVLDIPGLNQEIIELPVIEFLNTQKCIKEKVVENIKLPANLVIGKDNFLFKVKDNKLIQSGVFENDYVIVDRNDEFEKKKITIGITKNYEIILGNFSKYGEHINVDFANSAYDPLVININEIKIIGQINGVLRVLK
ncbi:transcriptional repressor LexA [Paraclostridium bifermentans]|uniref:transcriptional repressor LexA n=1 Tax=Paraclostridium bifermentans TaxID=1490 RepID=UPI00387B1578